MGLLGTTSPPVSVCLTTYNRADALRLTIGDLLKQRYSDFELLIGDDCSTDETERICREFTRLDSRIKYFRNAVNLRMPGNLNRLLSEAKGSYVANVHDGDRYREDLLAQWRSALDRAPTAPFVFNAYDAISADGKRRLYREPFRDTIPGLYIAYHFLSTSSCCVWGTTMARASAYREAGYFDPRFGFISDVDMWLRLARDRDVAYVPEALITVTPREKSHRYAQDSWDLLFWHFAIYVRHLAAYRAALGADAEYFARTYGRRLRRRFLWSLLSLVRNGQGERVREGLAIWRDSDDRVLRTIGRVMGRKEWRPAWYSAETWATIRMC